MTDWKNQNCAYDPTALACPFCGAANFDAIGLKMHLLNGWCDSFNNVEPPKSQQAVSGFSKG